MKTRFVFFLHLSIACTWLTAQPALKHGDLIFQELNCGNFCEAIQQVTPSFGNLHLNHVGIVVKTDSGLFVLEAISRGVVLTPLDSFLSRTPSSKMVIARAPRRFVFSLSAIDNFLHKPYDTVFDLDNDAYYCSELAYFLYTTKKRKHLFRLQPMTFKDPATREFHPLWVDYFQKLGQPIPEGKPGLNPGSMLQERRLRIIKKPSY